MKGYLLLYLMYENKPGEEGVHKIFSSSYAKSCWHKSTLVNFNEVILKFSQD